MKSHLHLLTLTRTLTLSYSSLTWCSTRNIASLTGARTTCYSPADCQQNVLSYLLYALIILLFDRNFPIPLFKSWPIVYRRHQPYLTPLEQSCNAMRELTSVLLLVILLCQHVYFGAATGAVCSQSGFGSGCSNVKEVCASNNKCVCKF